MKQVNVVKEKIDSHIAVSVFSSFSQKHLDPLINTLCLCPDILSACRAAERIYGPRVRTKDK